MGTTARISVVSASAPREAAALLDLGQRRVARLEELWSRFLPTSEISRLNRARGRAVRVSSETRLLVRRAVAAARDTGGRFDPTVHNAAVAAGYDRSFEALPRVVDTGMPTGPAPGCAEISIHDDEGTVMLPRGCGFDPGGIGKGLAADFVVDELLAAGAQGACVELGGDVRVRGAAPEGRGWVIAVADPRSPGEVVGSVWLDDGGVASSSVLRRSWTTTSGRAHHLIDPASGAPADSGILGACVVAATASLAESYATAACVGMPIAEIESRGVSGMAFDAHGVPTVFGDVDMFCA